MGSPKRALNSIFETLNRQSNATRAIEGQSRTFIGFLQARSGSLDDRRRHFLVHVVSFVFDVETDRCFFCFVTGHEK
jgi:hypothetical protein